MSEASPVSGEERERRVAVELESGRVAHLFSAALGVAGGGVLVWKLGVVGQVIGALVLLFGVYNAVALVRALRHPAGRIEVSDAGVTLPVGLCRPGRVELALADVRHAFFLRRAVPWRLNGPLLVIESRAAGVPRSHVFPRDWFASDADQRRVAHALNKRLGRLP